MTRDIQTIASLTIMHSSDGMHQPPWTKAHLSSVTKAIVVFSSSSEPPHPDRITLKKMHRHTNQQMSETAYFSVIPAVGFNVTFSGFPWSLSSSRKDKNGSCHGKQPFTGCHCDWVDIAQACKTLSCFALGCFNDGLVHQDHTGLEWLLNACNQEYQAKLIAWHCKPSCRAHCFNTPSWSQGNASQFVTSAHPKRSWVPTTNRKNFTDFALTTCKKKKKEHITAVHLGTVDSKYYTSEVKTYSQFWMHNPWNPAGSGEDKTAF